MPEITPADVFRWQHSHRQKTYGTPRCVLELPHPEGYSYFICIRYSGIHGLVRQYIQGRCSSTPVVGHPQIFLENICLRGCFGFGLDRVIHRERRRFAFDKLNQFASEVESSKRLLIGGSRTAAFLIASVGFPALFNIPEWARQYSASAAKSTYPSN